MKQLILTFFAVILCYSLFFDKKPKTHAVDEIDYIHQDAALVPNLKIVNDTVNYFALYFDSECVYFPSNYYSK